MNCEECMPEAESRRALYRITRTHTPYLFRFETIPSYIRMCVESWIYRQNITDIAKQRNMCVDL